MVKDKGSSDISLSMRQRNAEKAWRLDTNSVQMASVCLMK